MLEGVAGVLQILESGFVLAQHVQRQRHVDPRHCEIVLVMTFQQDADAALKLGARLLDFARAVQHRAEAQVSQAHAVGPPLRGVGRGGLLETLDRLAPSLQRPQRLAFDLQGFADDDLVVAGAGDGAGGLRQAERLGRLVPPVTVDGYRQHHARRPPQQRRLHFLDATAAPVDLGDQQPQAYGFVLELGQRLPAVGQHRGDAVVIAGLPERLKRCKIKNVLLHRLPFQDGEPWAGRIVSHAA